MSPVRTTDEEGARFLRLLDDNPDLFTIVGSVEFVAAYSNADQWRHITARYGTTTAIGGTPRWFYADTRPTLTLLPHPVDLRLEWCEDRAEAERMWRVRLAAKIDGNQWLLDELTNPQIRQVALTANQYAEALADLTTTYTHLTGLPTDAACACLLGRIPPDDVHQVTQGDPTPDQVDSYTFIGRLRAPTTALGWLVTT